MTDIIDVVVANFITNSWPNYDKKNKGKLDKEESKAFVKDLMSKVPGHIFIEKDYETLFTEYDKDKNGSLEKAEMALFVKRLLKVDVAPEVASAVKKGKKGKKEKKKKGAKVKKGKKGKKGAVDLNILNLLTQNMGQQQPQVVTEQVHHYNTINTQEKIYLPGEIQYITLPGQNTHTTTNNTTMMTTMTKNKSKSTIKNTNKIAGESSEYDEEDDYDEEEGEDEGEETKRTEKTPKTKNFTTVSAAAVESVQEEKVQTTFKPDGLPQEYSSSIVYTIGEDPFMLDLPCYKAWPQVQRSLQQQNGSPCPEMIYLAKTKIGVQTDDNKKKGKYYMMLTSTAGEHSDTQYFKVEIKENVPSARPPQVKEEETLSVKGIVKNIQTKNTVEKRRNSFQNPDKFRQQTESSRERTEAPDFKQSRYRSYTKNQIATNTRLLKQDLKEVKITSYNSVSKFLTNVEQDLPKRSPQSMSLLVSLKNSMELERQTDDVKRALVNVTRMIEEREKSSSQDSKSSNESQAIAANVKKFEQRIEQVVDDPTKVKIYLEKVVKELPPTQRLQILTELRTQLKYQKSNKEIQKALNLVKIEIDALKRDSDVVSEDSLTERTEQKRKFQIKASLSSEGSSRQNYKSRDISVTEQRQSKRDELNQEEVTSRSKKLKKELLQVLDSPNKEDVEAFIGKVNKDLPSDSPESLTIFKLLQESLLEEKPDQEIKQCLKKVNSEILKRQDSENKLSKRSTNSDRLGAEFIKITLDPSEKNIKEFIEKVNKDKSKDDPENQKILKELKKALMQSDQTPETKSSLKYLNKEIEIHNDPNIHDNSKKNSHSDRENGLKRSPNNLAELNADSIDNKLKVDMNKVTNDPTEKNAKEFVEKVNKNLAKDDPESHKILKELKRSITLAQPTSQTKSTLKYIDREIDIRKTEIPRARHSTDEQSKAIKNDMQKVLADPNVKSIEKFIDKMDKDFPNNSSQSLEVLKELSRQLSIDKQPSQEVKKTINFVNNEVQKRVLKLNEDSTFDKSRKSFQKDDSRVSLTNFIQEKFKQKDEEFSDSDEDINLRPHHQSSHGTFGRKKLSESSESEIRQKNIKKPKENIKIVDSRNKESSESDMQFGNYKRNDRQQSLQQHGNRDHKQSPRDNRHHQGNQSIGDYSPKDQKQNKDRSQKISSRDFSHRRNNANVPNVQTQGNDAPIPYSEQRESRRRSRQDRALFSPKTTETVADAEFKRKFNNFFVQGSQLNQNNQREEENQRWLQQQLSEPNHQATQQHSGTKVSNFVVPKNQQQQFTPNKFHRNPFPTTTQQSPMDKSPHSPIPGYSPGHNQIQFQVNQDNASPHNQYNGSRYTGSPNKPYSDSSIERESSYKSPDKKPNPPKHISPRVSPYKISTNTPSPDKLRRNPYQNPNNQSNLTDKKKEKDVIRDVSPKKSLENLVRLKINQLTEENAELQNKIQEIKVSMQIPDKDLLPEGFVRDQNENSFGLFDDLSLEEEKEINRQIRLQLEVINQNVTRMKQAVQNIENQKMRQHHATQMTIQEQEQLLKSYIYDQTNQAQVVKDKNMELEHELKDTQSAFTNSKELNKKAKRELVGLTTEENEKNVELGKHKNKNDEAQTRFLGKINEIEEIQTANEEIMNEITAQEARLAKQESEVEELRKQQQLLKEIKHDDEAKQQLQNARIQELGAEVQYLATQVQQKQSKLISEFAQLQKISNQIALAKSQHEKERMNRNFKRQQELENQQRILKFELENQELKESLSAKKRRLGLGPLTKAILDEYDDHLPEKQFMIKPYVTESVISPKSNSRQSPQRQSRESLERNSSQTLQPVVPQFVNQPNTFTPNDNAIIGGGEDDLSDCDRFTTTYKQFANQERFRGPPEGERGGHNFSDFSPSWNQIREDHKPPQRKELSSSRERLVNEGSEMAALLRPGNIQQVKLGQHTFNSKVSPTSRKQLLAKLPHLRAELVFLQGERQAQKTLSKKRGVDEKITNVQNRISEIENQIFN